MGKTVLPAEKVEDQSCRVQALVGGDGQAVSGAREFVQQFADTGIGRRGLIAAAVVAGLEGLTEAGNQCGIGVAGEQLQGFCQWRADDVIADGAHRGDAGSGKSGLETGQNGRGGIDQGTVEIEEDVRIAGHGGVRNQEKVACGSASRGQWMRAVVVAGKGVIWPKRCLSGAPTYPC